MTATEKRKEERGDVSKRHPPDVLHAGPCCI